MAMDLELDQLELRYEALRVRSPERERRLLASLSEVGQIMPVVVVRPGDGSQRAVLIDGYRRVRALRRLRRDVAHAMQWELSEVDALLLRRSLSIGNGETSLEQAWLLEELRERFSLSLQDLARRFDRTSSWVSRRLALVRELPATIQELIREGRIVAHAAAKHLVPLARANLEHCERLARNIAPHRLSTREVGELYAAWRDAAPSVRARIVDDPQLFLKSRAELAKSARDEAGPRTGLLEDLAAVAAITRRAYRRWRSGAAAWLSSSERHEVGCSVVAARAGFERLADGISDSIGGDHARSGNANGDPSAQEEGDVGPANRQGALDLAGSGAGGPAVGDARGAEARAGGEGGAFP